MNIILYGTLASLAAGLIISIMNLAKSSTVQ